MMREAVRTVGLVAFAVLAGGVIVVYQLVEDAVRELLEARRFVLAAREWVPQ